MWWELLGGMTSISVFVPSQVRDTCVLIHWFYKCGTRGTRAEAIRERPHPLVRIRSGCHVYSRLVAANPNRDLFGTAGLPIRRGVLVPGVSFWGGSPIPVPGSSARVAANGYTNGSIYLLAAPVDRWMVHLTSGPRPRLA